MSALVDYSFLLPVLMARAQRVRATNTGADINCVMFASSIEILGTDAKRAVDALPKDLVRYQMLGRAWEDHKLGYLVFDVANCRQVVDLLSKQYSVAILEGSNTGTGYTCLCVVPSRGETAEPKKQLSLWED